LDDEREKLLAALKGARFDGPRFQAALHTRAFGRPLHLVDITGSTNDAAWTALSERGHGATVIALAQSSGPGRAGRAWVQVPGRGLALSVGGYTRTGVRPGGLLPLAAGLAVARTAAGMGLADARLKWPNDVVAGGRKLAGVLCEARFTSQGDAAVVGIGVNVRHRRDDFPPGLRDSATSFALAGVDAALEDVAARLLDELEALWDRLDAGDPAYILSAWTALCDQWGRSLRVRVAGTEVAGIAARLDPDGALVLNTPGGEARIVAGDVEPAPESARP